MTKRVLFLFLLISAIASQAELKFSSSWKSVEENFRTPDDPSPYELRLDSEDEPTKEELKYEIRNYNDVVISSGQAVFRKEKNCLELPLPKTVGYFEIIFPAADYRRGLVLHPLHGSPTDSYFGADTSFSWRGGTSDVARKELVGFSRLLKKNGVTVARDRIKWSTLNPEEGKYEFDNRFSMVRDIFAEEGLTAIDTVHDTPRYLRDWEKRSEGYEYQRDLLFPNNYFAAAASWSTIMKKFSKSVTMFEYWNEPDIWFGNYFPPEYVNSFGKAISRGFYDAGVSTKVVAGCFAEPRLYSDFYGQHLDNGLLDDADAFSFHCYMDTNTISDQICKMRAFEKTRAPESYGIPYYLTETGKSWRPSHLSRAPVAADIFSASEIIGKAVEFRAWGGQLYVLFELRYYKEGLNNFGTMDSKATPMRQCAAYFYLTRAISNSQYLGELRGVEGFFSHVFEGPAGLVCVLYSHVSEKRTVQLPEELQVLNAAYPDGSPMMIKDSKVDLSCGIAYLYLPSSAKKIINTDSRAMQYYQLTNKYMAQNKKRAAKPLVLQPNSDLKQFFISSYGVSALNPENIELIIRVNNFGDSELEFDPQIQVPDGVKLLGQDSALAVSSKEFKDYRFRIAFDGWKASNDYAAIMVEDKNRNATRLCFSVKPYAPECYSVSKTDIPKFATVEEYKKNLNWLELGGLGAWHPVGSLVPTIRASFAAGYTDDKLTLVLLVKDSAQHVADNFANSSGFLFTLQQRDENGAPVGKSYRPWTRVTAGLSADGIKMTGINGNVEVQNLNDNYICYRVTLDGKECKLQLEPQSKIGFSLAVREANSKGMDGYLKWGEGILGVVDHLLFNQLDLQKSK